MTCDDFAWLVGGAGGGQPKWRTAGGGGKGRVFRHHVATGECHRAVGEAQAQFHRERTDDC